MKVLAKNLLALAVVVPMAVACSKATFSELGSSGLETENGDVETTVPGKRPPAIVWVQVPGDSQLINEPVTIVYDIIPGTSPVTSIVCQVDGKPVPCSIDGDTITITDGTIGDHNLEIIVVDAENQQVQDNVDWTVHQSFQKVKTPVAVKKKQGPVDILFVVDNSKSMQKEQSNMANRISNFIERVNGLDWRLAIITTDILDKNKTQLSDGRFIKFPNGNYYITSSLSAEEAKFQFGKTIQRPEFGDYREMGIKATYRALQRGLSPKQNDSIYKDSINAGFFRKDAALAVIVLSDEEEAAKEDTQTSTLFMHKGTELVKYVKSSWGEQKLFQFHSIITRPGDPVCSAVADQTPGVAYAELSQLTGGVIGDICASDYGNQLTVIGQTVANLQKSYELVCKPKDINNDGVADVRVVPVNVTTTIPSYSLIDNTIVFEKPLEVGNYSIEYFCPN